MSTNKAPSPPYVPYTDEISLNPPEYAPYNASFFTKDDGTVVSHDAHLNTDGLTSSLSLPLPLTPIPGEAFYRFLLSQSLQAPYYQLHCHGAHPETHYRYVTRQTDGRTETAYESETETVTDFDFLINIYPSLPTSTSLQSNSCGPIHWSVADSEPAYRGRMVQEIEQPLIGERHAAASSETKEYSAWRSERTKLGLPPWISNVHNVPSLEGTQVNEAAAFRSSKTLRQWADEYCASPKHLKEFMYEKVCIGLTGFVFHIIRAGSVWVEYRTARACHPHYNLFDALQWQYSSALQH